MTDDHKSDIETVEFYDKLTDALGRPELAALLYEGQLPVSDDHRRALQQQLWRVVLMLCDERDRQIERQRYRNYIHDQFVRAVQPRD